MGKTQNTGNLTNALAQDSSNNIGIGGAANASYKLQVTGATNLTGALSGTTGSFSVNVENSNTGLDLKNSGALGYGNSINFFQNTTKAIQIFSESSAANTSEIEFRTLVGGTLAKRFKIEATGAATFSSSVTARQGIINGLGGSRYQMLTLSGGGVSDEGLFITTTGTGNDFYAIKVATGASANAFAVTNAGNVGIGTTFVISPYLGSGQSGVLQVATNVAKAATGGPHPVAFFSSNDATYPLGLLVQILTGSTTSARQVKLQGTEIGVSANDIVMQTDGGNVSIGTTDSGRKLSVKATYTPGFFHNNNNASGQYCNIWQLGGSETNGTSSYYLLCDTDFVGVRMVIYGNGNIANVNNVYGAYSDIKLKENIVDATPKLNDLLKVKVRSYNLKGDNTKQIGVVAQELEEIFPGLIEESNDTIKDENGQHIETGEKTKSVKYSVFVPMLIKAIQELKAEIDELKNR
jgi:hypothetical protein